MTRINTNVSSLISQRVLGQNNNALTTSLERLSTGLRINRGKDDPAGLIASENLRSEIGGLKAALGNADRADQVANIAEGGLQEVANLLTELQGLITQTANTAAVDPTRLMKLQPVMMSLLRVGFTLRTGFYAPAPRASPVGCPVRSLVDSGRDAGRYGPGYDSNY